MANERLHRLGRIHLRFDQFACGLAPEFAILYIISMVIESFRFPANLSLLISRAKIAPRSSERAQMDIFTSASWDLNQLRRASVSSMDSLVLAPTMFLNSSGVID